MAVVSNEATLVGGQLATFGTTPAKLIPGDFPSRALGNLEHHAKVALGIQIALGIWPGPVHAQVSPVRLKQVWGQDKRN